MFYGWDEDDDDTCDDDTRLVGNSGLFKDADDNEIKAWLEENDFHEDPVYKDVYRRSEVEHGTVAALQVTRVIKAYVGFSRYDGTYSYCIRPLRGSNKADWNDDVLPLRNLKHLKDVYKTTLTSVEDVKTLTKKDDKDEIKAWLADHNFQYFSFTSTYKQLTTESGAVATVQVMRMHALPACAVYRTYCYRILGVDDWELNTDILLLYGISHLESIYWATLKSVEAVRAIE